MTRGRRSYKRKAEPPKPQIDPDVARFAERNAQARNQAKAEKQAARDARRHAEEGTRLQAAKDAAAAEVKRLQRRGRVSAEERSAADAAYRAALAALLTHEKGEAPAWAASAAIRPDAAGHDAGGTDTGDAPGTDGREDGDEPEAPAAGADAEE